MSFASLKNYIFGLSDLSFLSIVSNVDFYNKKITIKKTYWNLIIGSILEVVEIPSRTQMRKLVSRLKEVLLRRLSIVSARSMKRFFLHGISCSFRNFEEEFLNRFFGEENVQDDIEPIPSPPPPSEDMFPENDLHISESDQLSDEVFEDESIPDEDLHTFAAIERGSDEEYDEYESDISDLIPQYDEAMHAHFTGLMRSVPPDANITNPYDAHVFLLQGEENSTRSEFTPGQTFE